MSAVLSVPRRTGVAIRVRGVVQGVGFRPTVWRLARDHGLVGEVWNDARGVAIRAWGEAAALERFAERLRREAPPLARIDAVEATPLASAPSGSTFRIVASQEGPISTGVAPDAATCPQCMADTLDPGNRRFNYPFTNCTHCGPRLSIVHAIPYDRTNTSMVAFPMCEDCQAEYDDPNDRRFHAQPNACPVCGPRARLEPADGRPFERRRHLEVASAAGDLLMRGAIVAIKGIGGFHLACDACNSEAVSRLRELKRRSHKPFALMARDLEVIRQYCVVTAEHGALLRSAAAPIVILARAGRDVITPNGGPRRVADLVAPGQNTLGFMLPYTPLHHLLLARIERPIVLTSGNLSEEPQCTGNLKALEKLSSIADWMLTHDRMIENRLDDSVARIMDGGPRVLRRARGYAPAAIALPDGFESSPQILALGGELKNTFCLVKDGQAILSQHMGDLEDATTFADYRKNLVLYRQLFEHRPQVVAVDRHPEYLSTKLGKEWAERDGLALEEVQHHHAHVVSCMAENRLPLNTAPVLGVALDGLGYGEDGALWGGEFLLSDYAGFERLATCKPVAMPGGAKAIREPWRNTYAHIVAAIGWADYLRDYRDLELTRFLEARPLTTLDRMMANGINSPRSSSCGRLFDAVAGAIGICREQAGYEGQAAIELEARVHQHALEQARDGYPFNINCFLPLGGRSELAPDPASSAGQALIRGWGECGEKARSVDPQLLALESSSMWRALLHDLARNAAPGIMAAKFHAGLARAIVEMVRALRATTRLAAPDSSAHRGPRFGRPNDARFDTVALTGGVFQNKILLEQAASRLRAEGLRVISHRHVPANDGGLSLGQAAIAAARSLQTSTKGEQQCV